MSQEVYHIPALLAETITGLDIKPGGTYVDVTYGGGGHSRAIIGHLGEGGHLYGFDQDIDAVRRASDSDRFTIVHSNFRYITNFLRFHGVEQVDGILADLGVSFHHFDDSERGFSFRFDGPLDMRMNREGSLTAATVVNTYSEERLAKIFKVYGEMPSGRRLAAAIAKARNSSPIDTIGQLLEVVKPLIDPRREKKELACVFQALRIEVNDEMGALRSLLEQSARLLKEGGRLCVITYHSLEDRMVKNFIKTGNIMGKVETDFFGRSSTPLKPVGNKPVTPSGDEIQRNPRSRSAKLRIAVKVN